MVTLELQYLGRGAQRLLRAGTGVVREGGAPSCSKRDVKERKDIKAPAASRCSGFSEAPG